MVCLIDGSRHKGPKCVKTGSSLDSVHYAPAMPSLSAVSGMAAYTASLLTLKQ
jgi:hypothetical protein